MRFSKLRSTLISFYVVQMSKTKIIIEALIPKRSETRNSSPSIIFQNTYDQHTVFFWYIHSVESHKFWFLIFMSIQWKDFNFKTTLFLFFPSILSLKLAFSKKTRILKTKSAENRWKIGRIFFFECGKNCLTTLLYLQRHFLYLKCIDVEYLDAKSDVIIPIIEKHKPTRYILTR